MDKYDIRYEVKAEALGLKPFYDNGPMLKFLAEIVTDVYDDRIAARRRFIEKARSHNIYITDTQADAWLIPYWRKKEQADGN